MPLGEEFPLERGHQRGVPPLEIVIFGSSSVKTVAGRHSSLLVVTSTADVLSSVIDIDDLERP